MKKPTVRILYQLAVEADCDIRLLKSLLRGEPREHVVRSRTRAKELLIREGYLSSDAPDDALTSV